MNESVKKMLAKAAEAVDQATDSTEDTEADPILALRRVVAWSGDATFRTLLAVIFQLDELGDKLDDIKAKLASR